MVQRANLPRDLGRAGGESPGLVESHDLVDVDPARRNDEGRRVAADLPARSAAVDGLDEDLGVAESLPGREDELPLVPTNLPEDPSHERDRSLHIWHEMRRRSEEEGSPHLLEEVQVDDIGLQRRGPTHRPHHLANHLLLIHPGASHERSGRVDQRLRHRVRIEGDGDTDALRSVRQYHSNRYARRELLRLLPLALAHPDAGRTPVQRRNGPTADSRRGRGRGIECLPRWGLFQPPEHVPGTCEPLEEVHTPPLAQELRRYGARGV